MNETPNTAWSGTAREPIKSVLHRARMMRRPVVAFAAAVIVAGSVVSSGGQVSADSNEAGPGVGRGAGSAISAGEYHTRVLLASGAVKCWGNGSVGRLGQGGISDIGDGPNEMGDNLAPVALGAGRTATAVAAGSAHSCALLDNGAVKCWGFGGFGQLGQGDTDNIGDGPAEMGDNLAPVALGAGRTATAVAAGVGYSCALLDNGAVKCWGLGGDGRLGQGDTDNIGDGPGEMGDNLAPVALGAGRTATAVAAGYFHTCALLDNGAVKCWGFGGDGC